MDSIINPTETPGTPGIRGGSDEFIADGRGFSLEDEMAKLGFKDSTGDYVYSMDAHYYDSDDDVKIIPNDSLVFVKGTLKILVEPDHYTIMDTEECNKGCEHCDDIASGDGRDDRDMFRQICDKLQSIERRDATSS